MHCGNRTYDTVHSETLWNYYEQMRWHERSKYSVFEAAAYLGLTVKPHRYWVDLYKMSTLYYLFCLEESCEQMYRSWE